MVGFITIESQNTCMTMLIITPASQAVFILQVTILIACAYIEIILLAATNSIIKTNISNSRYPDSIQPVIFLAHIVAQNIITHRSLQAIRSHRNGIVEAVVVEVAARK